MIDWIRQLFALSALGDNEGKARLAGPLKAILLTIAVLSVGIVAWQLITHGAPSNFAERFVFITAIAFAGIYGALLILVRRGHVIATGFVVSFMVWIVTTLWVYSAGGIRDTSVAGYFLVVVAAGLILGGRAAVFFGLLCVATVSLAFYLQISGYLNVVIEPLMPFDLIVLLLNLVVTMLLLRFAVRSTREAFHRARRNEQALVESNRALQAEVAERKRTEDALRVETAYLERLFEGAPEAIVLTDNDGSILRINSEFTRIFGYALDEVRGKPIDALLASGELHEEAAAITQRVAQGDVVTLESMRQRKDGTWVDVSILGTPITVDGGQVAVYGIYRDITGRKRAEAEREQLLADFQRQRNQLQTAAEISRVVSSILEPNELIQRVVDLVRERFNLCCASLFLVDRSGEWTGELGKWAVLRASTGETGQQLLAQGHKLEIDDRTIVGWSIINRQARLVLDEAEKLLGFGNPSLPETRSSLVLPLISRGEAIGALAIQSSQESAFSDEDIVVFEVMADQLANAIQNAYLFEDVRERTERLMLLNRIARAVSAATPHLDDLLEVAYREISAVFQADAFCIAFYNKETEELDFHFRMDEEIVEPYKRRPVGTGLISQIVTTRKPLLIGSYRQEREHLPIPELFGLMKQPMSWLGVPMFSASEVMGVVCVQAYRPYAWGEEDQLLLSIIADEVAVAVRNARLYEQAQQEIRERRQAEEALRERERRYRQSVESSPNPIFSVDRAGTIQSWNQACEQIFQYGPEIIGRHYGQLLLNLEDQQPTVEQWLNKVFQKRALADLDMYYRCKGGTERFMVSRLYPLIGDEGEVQSCVFANTDITERIEAEMALAESEERYRTLVTQAPIGVITCDRAGNVTHLNPAAIEILGFSEDDQICDLNLMTLPLLVKGGIAEDIRLCIKGAEEMTVECHCPSYEGVETILRFHSTPLRDEAGNVRGALAVVEDVTEQRQLEERLVQSAKLASIGELAAGVAHEINNPINGIINYAQLLMNRVPPDSHQTHFLEGILREGNRVADIVRDLLTFAHVERDSHSLAHIHDILQATLALSSKQLQKDGIHLEVEEAPDLPQIRCRSQRIQQVFLNLISNARHALNARYPEGDPNKRLTIRTELVEKEGQSRWIRTAFHDRGVGIAAGDQSRLFTPFFTTKRPGEGTGLGLSVSYGIVQDHGGDIWLESVEGEYTIFYVDLPVAPEQEERG